MITFILSLLFNPASAFAGNYQCQYDYRNMQEPMMIRQNFKLFADEEELAILVNYADGESISIEARKNANGLYMVDQEDTAKLLKGTILFLRSVLIHSNVMTKKKIRVELRMDSGIETQVRSNFYDCSRN